METKKLKATSENIAYSGEIIAAGGLVAFPTETVYGLGANGFDIKAIEKIYKAKGRPSDNPMIFHISSPLHLEALAKIINLEIEALIVSFWPGPLTLVVRKTSIVPDIATGGLDTVAVRMPNHPVALELIEKAECPIVAPSANLSGRPSPTRHQDVWEDMDGRIDAVLEGDDCQVGIESTVVDMTVPGQVTILRPGVVTARDIRKALDEFNLKDVKLIAYSKNIEPEESEKNPETIEAPKSPGMKYRHYAPKAEMIVIEGERQKVKDEIDRLKKEASQEKNRSGDLKRVEILFLEEMDPWQAAQQFFARLRELDRQDVDLILAAAIKQDDDSKEEVGDAVMNRMIKASGYRVVKV